MSPVEHLLHQYGYFGLFGLLTLGVFGLPVPDETLLTFAGYLVYRGELHLVSTLATGFLGSAAGISISYVVGRGLGPMVFQRLGPWLHLTAERMDRVNHWFQTYGKWLLTLGYFVPGLRHLTALAAGGSRLPWRMFAPFAYTGALVWSATFIAIGYGFGQEWRETWQTLNHHRAVALAILAGAGVVWFAGRRLWLRRRCRGLGSGG